VTLANRMTEVPKWVADQMPHATIVRRILANTTN
jgi:hypothetical protein